MVLRCSRVAALPVLAVGLTACGDGSSGSSGAESAPAVVASTSIWADITANVACGAPVASLIPAGADPHSFEPSLRDRELASGATVLVANGAGLEATTEELLDAAIADGVNVVEIATHIDLLAAPEDGEAEHEHDGHEAAERAADGHTAAEHGEDEPVDDGHGHDHGAGDPHVWQDPSRIAGALDVVASALAAEGFDTCETEYRDQLLALDAEIADILAPIPAHQRMLVTSHDSLAYFADRYGFEIVGAVIPSTSTLAEASAGELADLTELIEERSVRAIFTDAFESAGDAEALADRIGIPVVPLVTDALTEDGPTYAEMMRSNATTIADALAP